MIKYKVLFWVLVFAVYLFMMWFALPDIGTKGMVEKGLEIDYLSAVLHSHIAVIAMLLFLFAFGWLANKSGY